MAEANVRIPEEARDRLAAMAAAEGLSLRAYLARPAETLLTPAERAERAEKARTALKKWNGYAPTEAEQQGLDGELDRRLAQVTGFTQPSPRPTVPTERSSPPPVPEEEVRRTDPRPGSPRRSR